MHTVISKWKTLIIKLQFIIISNQHRENLYNILKFYIMKYIIYWKWTYDENDSVKEDVKEENNPWKFSLSVLIVARRKGLSKILSKGNIKWGSYMLSIK